MHALYRILWARWRGPSGAGLVSRAGLQNFNFLFAEGSIPLRDNMPLSGRLKENSLALSGNGKETSLTLAATDSVGKSVWIDPSSNIGNRALRYLAAEGIRQHSPDIAILNKKLYIWAMDAEAERLPDCLSARIGDQIAIDVEGLAETRW